MAQESKILIVGDLLIDSTHYVEVTKLSPEAPVPVAMLTGEAIETPGGAGLAAALASKDNIPFILCTYTNKTRAQWLKDAYCMDIISGELGEYGKSNAIKTRYVDVESKYHLLRVDSDMIVDPPMQDIRQEDIWVSEIEEYIKNNKVAAITILDYNKGLLSKTRPQRLISIAKLNNIPVYVDSRSKNLDKFFGSDILKLNEKEFSAACSQYNIDSSPERLASILNVHNIIITKGARGADIFPLGISVIPSTHEGSPDVTGCGDVFDVTFCYNYYIKKEAIEIALQNAVDRATRFAYEPIGERLNCQN